MVKRLFIVIPALIIGLFGSVEAQDAHFSQFYANALYLNPAFAGADNCPRLSLNYRNQWPALGSTYETYSMSYDQYFHPLQGGIGLHLMNDVQGGGTIETTTISGMYSYTLSVTRRFFIAAGFQASYVMKQIDWDFIFPNMIHPLYGPIYSSAESPEIINENKNYVDFTTGLIAFSEKTFFGMAIYHISAPS